MKILLLLFFKFYIITCLPIFSCKGTFITALSDAHPLPQTLGASHCVCDHSRDLRQTWTHVREQKATQHHQYPCGVRQIKNSILLPMTSLSCWSQLGRLLWLWALSSPKWDSSGSAPSIFKGKYMNLSVFRLLIGIQVMGGSSRSGERQTLFLPASFIHSLLAFSGQLRHTMSPACARSPRAWKEDM